MPLNPATPHPTSPPAGFVLVKKVPGTLHFAARSEGHSFDHAGINMTHVVHHLYFGSKWVLPHVAPLWAPLGGLVCVCVWGGREGVWGG